METYFRINFTTKKLPSGNVQVKFQVLDSLKPSYGYLLVGGDYSDQEIVDEIKKRLSQRSHSKMDLLRFTFKNEWKDDHQFFLYSA
ncbi:MULTISPECIES: hypothetical protein [Cyclobacterium]|uniref:DUF695 domain-containing protein n=1 Tax=Cyclobacterium plantarum TaxID=2716263 RepID=A0ABX0H931_9BACT|nr:MULTISPECIES: hypothetical protein [Cyclobacterium]MBD3628814.1 hypothetical protein [Cyclobacterium sp.]NHE56731.1 hypothetical protein [Cyclobacterium plantarum]